MSKFVRRTEGITIVVANIVLSISRFWLKKQTPAPFGASGQHILGCRRVKREHNDKRKTPAGEEDRRAFLSENTDTGRRRIRVPIALSAGGAQRANFLELGRFACDRRDVDPGDAEILKLTRREPNKLIVGLAVLPPATVGGDKPVHR